MVFPDFHTALLDWVTDLWPRLTQYQRRYIEGGHKDDDHHWAYDVAEAPLQGYAWQRVLAALRANDVLRQRLDEGLSTQAETITRSDGRPIAAAFWDEAHKRIVRNEVLLYDPKPLFDVVYPRIEQYFTTDHLTYRLTVALNDFAVAGQLELNATTMFSHLGNNVQADYRWNHADWYEHGPVPSGFVYQFSLPIVKGDVVPLRMGDEVRNFVTTALRSISVALRNTATIGAGVVDRVTWAPSSYLYRVKGVTFDGIRATTTIRSEHLEIVRAAWSYLNARVDPKVQIATGRLSLLGIRDDLDESVVDVATALEAILGEDASRELKHRISLLAARLTSQSLGMKQIEIYELLLALFEERTRVLRGLPRKDTPAELIMKLAEAVVRSLVQMRVLNDPRMRLNQLDLLLGYNGEDRPSEITAET